MSEHRSPRASGDANAASVAEFAVDPVDAIALLDGALRADLGALTTLITVDHFVSPGLGKVPDNLQGSLTGIVLTVDGQPAN
jgi:hypothetical protein